METTIWGLGFRWNGKEIEGSIMGDIGTTIRVHSFIPSLPKASPSKKGAAFGRLDTLRVQVPNNHILTQNL